MVVHGLQVYISRCYRIGIWFELSGTAGNCNLPNPYAKQGNRCDIPVATEM